MDAKLIKDALITGVNVVENQALMAKEYLQEQNHLACYDAINQVLFQNQLLRKLIEEKINP